MHVWVLIREVEYDSGQWSEPTIKVPEAIGAYLRAEDATTALAKHLLSAANVSYDSESITIPVEAGNYRILRTILHGDLGSLTEPQETPQYASCPLCGFDRCSPRQTTCPRCVQFIGLDVPF